MATAGQDGKVIIWNVTVPTAEDGSPPATTEGAGDGTDTSTSNASTTRRRNGSTDTLASPHEDTGVDVSSSHQGAGARSSGKLVTRTPEVGAGGPGETYLDTESTSTAPSDDGLGGRGMSDLGLAAGGRDGKEQGFPGSEVREERAGRAPRARPDQGGRFECGEAGKKLVGCFAFVVDIAVGRRVGVVPEEDRKLSRQVLEGKSCWGGMFFLRPHGRVVWTCSGGCAHSQQMTAYRPRTPHTT